jgi:hypothetical protein
MWLNLIVDDHQGGNSTKLGEKQKKTLLEPVEEFWQFLLN